MDTHIESDTYNATEKMKLNIRLFMNDLFESMAEFIEGAAAFRIENKNQHYEFYKFPPFNGEVFESFVNELGQAFANQRPVRANMERSQRYIEVGNVQSALTSASRAIAATSDQQLRNHLRENNATLVAEIDRQTTEGLLPIISTLAEGMGASAEVLNQLSYSTGHTAHKRTVCNKLFATFHDFGRRSSSCCCIIILVSATLGQNGSAADYQWVSTWAINQCLIDL